MFGWLRKLFRRKPAEDTAVELSHETHVQMPVPQEPAPEPAQTQKLAPHSSHEPDRPEKICPHCNSPNDKFVHVCWMCKAEI